MPLPNKKVSFFTGRTAVSILFALSILLAACGGSTVTPDGGLGAGSGGGDGGGEDTSAPTDAPKPAATGLCASDFFPVLVGATWVSTGTSSLTGDFTYTSTITEVSETGFTLTHDFTDVSTTQQWSCTAEGLAALQYGGGPEATLSASGGVSGNFETFDTTGVTFPTHIVSGDTWEQSFTVHGEIQLEGESLGIADGTVTQSYVALGLETITVPAGTFEAMKVQATVSFDLLISLEGISVPMTFAGDTLNWWAAGVGGVKSDSTSTIEGGDPIGATTQLESFSIP